MDSHISGPLTPQFSQPEEGLGTVKRLTGFLHHFIWPRLSGAGAGGRGGLWRVQGEEVGPLAMGLTTLESYEAEVCFHHDGLGGGWKRKICLLKLKGPKCLLLLRTSHEGEEGIILNYVSLTDGDSSDFTANCKGKGKEVVLLGHEARSVDSYAQELGDVILSQLRGDPNNHHDIKPILRLIDLALRSYQLVLLVPQGEGALYHPSILVPVVEHVNLHSTSKAALA
jgi:hypothetical protein